LGVGNHPKIEVIAITCKYVNLDPPGTPVSQILFQANICRNPSLDSGGRRNLGFLHSIWHGYGMGIILSALWSWYQNKMDGQHQHSDTQSSWLKTLPTILKNPYLS